MDHLWVCVSFDRHYLPTSAFCLSPSWIVFVSFLDSIFSLLQIYIMCMWVGLLAGSQLCVTWWTACGHCLHTWMCSKIDLWFYRSTSKELLFSLTILVVKKLLQIVASLLKWVEHLFERVLSFCAFSVTMWSCITRVEEKKIEVDDYDQMIIVVNFSIYAVVCVCVCSGNVSLLGSHSIDSLGCLFFICSGFPPPPLPSPPHLF
jgi:hypothetical protein